MNDNHAPRDGGDEPLLAELERTLDEAAATRRSHRRLQTGVALALTGVLCAFLGLTWSRARTMYEPNELARCLQIEAQELRPDLERGVRNVLETAAPHYVQLGRERLERTLPKLSNELDAELTGLSGALADHAADRIGKAIADVQMRQLAALRSQVPALADEARFKALADKWARDVQVDTVGVLDEFRERVVIDIATLDQTIERYRPSEYENYERDDLVRQYAHLWLQLIDHDLLAESGYVAPAGVRTRTVEERDDG